MGRWLDRSNLKDVRNRTNPGVFIKPVAHKIFTGFVMTGSFSDMIQLAPYDEGLEVWLSQAVDFVSEYRCYVLRGEILGASLYRGDWSKAPNREIVEGAVKAWESQPVAWTLDVGVTPEGKTLLVEVNDGYAFGNYGLMSTSYARMLEAWWEKATKESK